MTNYKLFPALLSVAIISSSAAALAQTAVDAPNDGIQIETPKPQDMAPTTAAPSNEPSAVPPATTVYDSTPPATITTIPMDANMAAPTVVAIELPKADSLIIDKLINHLNNQEVEDIVAMFSKDGFIKVKNNGQVVKTPEDLRKELVDFFAGNKKHTFTSQFDIIKDIAPGVAIIGGYYNMFKEGDTTNPVSKMYGITVVRYEDNAWKVVSHEVTELSKESVAVTPEQSSGGGMKMTIVALLGIAIGFLGARFFPKKTPQ